MTRLEQGHNNRLKQNINVIKIEFFDRSLPILGKIITDQEESVFCLCKVAKDMTAFYDVKNT